MYYPIQIPYKMNREYAAHMEYSEFPPDSCGGFVICFWEMHALSERRTTVKNVIVADGCIDLVVHYDERSVGFAGMTETAFDFTIELPARFFGARMMPGAFYQLTGIPAPRAMDTFLPIEQVYAEFDREKFFKLDYERAIEAFRAFLAHKTRDRTADRYTSLFHALSENAPATAAELFRSLHFSPRQCQRLFLKHYGITPKKALSIVRFQRCLSLLTSPQAAPADILQATDYFDQPHFNNDFKRNLGITPMELIRLYRS